MPATVRVRVIYAPRRNMVYLRKFMNYLKKAGKGQDGGESDHFTRTAVAVDLDRFYEDLKGDGWCFQVILSPDPDRAPDLPLEGYARSWMLSVERHMNRTIDWVASAHYDEPDHLHVQMLWRGRDVYGKPLRLSRESIGYDLRALADQVEAFFP